MKITTPNYYKNFKCIGSACTDNCCIGWEIDIDNKTHEYYQNLSGSFGDRLRKSIEQGEDNHFILENERCPFLNENNLCDIIINLGEDKLCDICTNHPRFYEWFDGLTEKGIGLCCEAGGKLIFENEQCVTFETTYTDDKNDCIGIDNELFNALFKARHIVFNILQNRNLSITQRIGVILTFIENLQFCVDQDDIDEIYNIIEKYNLQNNIDDLVSKFNQYTNQQNNKLDFINSLINLYKDLEPIDKHWPELLSDVIKELPSILQNSNKFSDYYKKRTYEYEHLLVYFVYRYFMKSVFDKDLLAKIHLAISSYLVINILDIFHWTHNNHEFSFTDRIQIAKSYSKEIEYSQENLDILEDESFTNSLFNFDNLMIMLFS